MAAHPLTTFARNEPPWHFRRWRCTRRQSQACGVSRGRGGDGGRVCASSTSAVRDVMADHRCANIDGIATRMLALTWLRCVQSSPGAVVELWDVERPCPLLAAPREDFGL